jgi:MYXO-CTERM domain-containing protein
MPRMLFVLAAVLCVPSHLEADVTASGGDYVDVTFTVPEGTREIRIAHSDGSTFDILDWGVWSPDGFRGWGGGLTEDAVIGVEQSSRGYLPGPITPGTWTVVVGKAQLDGNGGHYAIDVTCSDTASLPVLPKAAFTPVRLDARGRWYRGDFHVHSRESGDSSASLDEIATLADQRGLDFVNLSDHNTVSQHALQAAFLVSHPDVLLLRGAEITTYAGHGNAVGLDDYVDHRIGYAGRTITGVLDDVGAQGAIFIVNHPTLDLGDACIGCAWEHGDTPWDRVSGMELITGNWLLSVSGFVPAAIEMWDGLLDRGYRIAAIGGSDDHTAGRGQGPNASPIGSPTTLVLADNLSEAAIIDAVRRGRTMVQLRGPDDPALDVTMRNGAGGESDIGADVVGISRVRIAIHVAGGDGMIAQVFRDGVPLEPDLPIVGNAFSAVFEEDPGAGAFRYRAEILTSGGQPVVITSHFYVDAIDRGSGGCACGAGGDVSGGVVPAVMVLAPWARRRRARPRRPASNSSNSSNSIDSRA